MSMLHQIQETVLSKIMASPMGVKLTAAAKREIFEHRQTLVQERERLEAVYEKRRPGLEAAVDKAQKHVDQIRDDLKAAEQAYTEALYARSSAATALDTARDRRINGELIATADPAIARFIHELHDRRADIQGIGIETSEERTDSGGTKYFSTKGTVHAALAGLRTATAAAEELKVAAVEDLGKALRVIRRGIPAVTLELVGENPWRP